MNDHDPDALAVTGNVDRRSGPPGEELTEQHLRAAVISHTIRLGKCPQVGDYIGGSYQVQASDVAVLQTGDLSQVKDVTQKKPFSFQVTREDIQAALALLEAAKITYPQPKVSVMPLRPIPQ